MLEQLVLSRRLAFLGALGTVIQIIAILMLTRISPVTISPIHNNVVM